MKFTYNKMDKSLELSITEEIDHHTAEKIRNRADYEIQKYMPRVFLIDFQNVQFMDSAGIGMIIGRYKTVSMFGGKVYMKNVNGSIKKVFEMSGILKIIPIIEGGANVGKCI